MGLIDRITKQSEQTEQAERGDAAVAGPWSDPPPPSPGGAAAPTVPRGVVASPDVYVSTDLRVWIPDGPEPYAVDIEVDDVPYRRLDLAYYGHLRYLMGRAMREFDAGRMAEAAFEGTSTRFAEVYARALDAWGQEALDQTEEEFAPQGYVPPKPASRVQISPDTFPGPSVSNG